MTQRVSAQIVAMVENVKADHGLRSFEAAVEWLYNTHPEYGDVHVPGEPNAALEEAPEAAPRQRKQDVCDALYSYDKIVERKGMLEYYTGLSKYEVDLLIDKLQDVRKSFFFFFFFFFLSADHSCVESDG